MQSHIERSNNLSATKVLIKRFFTSTIQEYMRDEDILAKAFNTRESINFNGNVCKQFKTSDEVKAALDHIRQKNSAYSYDVRTGLVFQAMGFTNQTQEKFLRIDEILKYEAIHYLAHFGVSKLINNLYNPLFNHAKFNDFEMAKSRNDKEIFEKELNTIAGNKIMSLLSPKIAIRQALRELHDSVSDIENLNLTLKDAGRAVLNTVQRLILNDLSLEKLAQLTEFVNETSKVVQNLSLENIQNYTQQVQKAIDISMDYPWIKTLGGAMLVFLGIALIITSIIVAVATFGGATPLSMLALPFGSSLIFSGTVLSAAAVTGVIATNAGGFFIAKSKTESLAGTMESVIKTPEFQAAMNQI